MLPNGRNWDIMVSPRTCAHWQKASVKLLIIALPLHVRFVFLLSNLPVFSKWAGIFLFVVNGYFFDLWFSFFFFVHSSLLSHSAHLTSLNIQHVSADLSPLAAALILGSLLTMPVWCSRSVWGGSLLSGAKLAPSTQFVNIKIWAIWG